MFSKQKLFFIYEKEINKHRNLFKKAQEVHGDKYDYSLVEYTDAKTPISIICKGTWHIQHASS